MEQYLAAALGRVNVSVDEIMNRAGQAPALRANPALPLLGWVLCLVLVGFVGLVLLLTFTIPPAVDAQRPLAAQHDKTPAANRDAPHAAGDQPADAAETGPAADPAAANPDAPMPPATPPAAPATPPAVAAQPAEPKQPWDVLALAEDRARPSSAALFVEVDQTVAPPREEDLKQWFAEVPGQPHGVGRKDFWGVGCGVLDGVWRLRAPLKPKTALRLSVAEIHNLKLHFWHGGEGVTLHYYDNLNRLWAAYHTTRKPNEARPVTQALIATDEDRCWRHESARAHRLRIAGRGRLADPVARRRARLERAVRRPGQRSLFRRPRRVPPNRHGARRRLAP